MRSQPAQPAKTITLTVFIITSFDANTQDKITVWDTIEGILDNYLNLVNGMTGLQIENIDKIEGEYYPEGLLSVDSEQGVAYSVTLKMFC
jgi:hypothetical protein